MRVPAMFRKVSCIKAKFMLSTVSFAQIHQKYLVNRLLLVLVYCKFRETATQLITM